MSEQVDTATISLQRLKELEGIESALKKKKNIYLFDTGRGIGGFVHILDESELTNMLVNRIVSLEIQLNDFRDTAIRKENEARKSFFR